MKKAIVALLVAVSLLTLFSLGVSAASKPTLEVWGRASFIDAVNQWYKTTIERWADEHDVNVRVSLLPYDQFNQKIFAAMASGAVPDAVINGWPVAFPAERGMLVPLDDIVLKLDPTDFFPLKLNQNKVGGHYYGIPMMYEPYVMNVRKDVLDAAGLPIPDDFKELAQAAKKVSNPAKDFYGFGHAFGQSFDGANDFLATLYSFGGGWLTTPDSPNGVDILNSKATVDALNWYLDLWKAKAIPPDATSWNDSGNNNAFLQGRIAMTFNPPSIYYTASKNNPDLAKKIVLAPVGDVVDGGEESAFVFAKSKYVDLAKDMIYNIFANKEAYRKGVTENSETYALPIFKSQAKVISDQWKKGQWPQWAKDPYQVLERTKYVWSPVAVPYGSATSIADQVSDTFVWSKLQSRVIVDGVSPQTAIKETMDRIKQLINEANKK